MSNRPEWLATSANELESDPEKRAAQLCGLTFSGMALAVAKDIGGQPVLLGLTGAAIAVGWSSGVDANALAAHLRSVADDIPKVYALYERDAATGKPN